jgi:hypothetical protein
LATIQVDIAFLLSQSLEARSGTIETEVNLLAEQASWFIRSQFADEVVG